MSKSIENPIQKGTEIVFFSEKKQAFIYLSKNKEITPDFQPLLISNKGEFIPFLDSIEKEKKTNYSFEFLRVRALQYQLANVISELTVTSKEQIFHKQSA